MSRELGSRYVLTEVLGRGATGEVWRGHDRDGATVACKLLHDSLARDPEVVRRFVQERSVLVGLDHPNLVRMHDLVVEGDTLAIVMDLVGGQDLRAALVAHGTLPPGEVCRLGADVAAGLAAAHEAGVVHRDIKPENILLDTFRSPAVARLTDFGIAKIAESSGTGRTTLLAGTPQYIAPELFDGQPPAPAVDLYALGILLYELCCGVTPFAGDSALAVLRRHTDHQPGRPEGIPDPLWEAISGLLVKDPRARLGPAGRVSNVLAALAHDLAAVPAAARRTEPPQSVPIIHTQPTELTARPDAAAASPPPAGRRRWVMVAAAGGVTAAIAVGIGAAVAFTGDSDRSGDPAGTTAPAAAGDPTDAPTPPSRSPSPEPEPGVMPELVGLSETRARAQLPDGVTVQVEAEPGPPGTPDGVVLEQEPPPGEPLGDLVVLTVAGSESTIHLVDLEPLISGGLNHDAVQLSGDRLLHSLVSGSWQRVTRETYTISAEYDLGRNYRQLTTAVGLADSSLDATADVLLEIYGDGQKLQEEPLAYGEPEQLEVDLTGILRLEFRWTYFDVPSGVSLSNQARVALGTPVLTAEPGYDPHEELDPST